MIGEVSAAFSSKFFHMGGDEAYQMGSCPKCAAWVKEHSLAELYALHYGRLNDIIRKQGKQAMMWGDMILNHREMADMLPKDMIMFDWHHIGGSPDTVKFFVGKGFKTFACPAITGYARPASPFKQSQENVWMLIGDGKNGGAIGECTQDWEYRIGILFDNDYFGTILSADRAWNTDGCTIDDFNRRFCKVFYGIDDLRPMQYFQAVCDDFVDIQLKHFPDFPTSSVRTSFACSDYPTTITDAMYTECLAHRTKCLEMLDGIRRDARHNRDTLGFADLPAHTTMLLVEKGYLLHKASTLAKEGKHDEAVAALKELLTEVDYFESRFKAAIKAFGGSTVDLVRVANLRKFAEKRMSEIQ
jgi:hypothetical protein